MKNLVWLFGVLLALSFFVPTGRFVKPQVTPIVPGETDPAIVAVLKPATVEDRNRVASIYTGLQTVITRDNGQLVNNTERLAVLQANTLKLAVDQVGKYPGLDKAIEAVFASAVGTDDVVTVTPEIATKLSAACAVIVNSANATK
jgi:hypothetical protein